MSKYNLHNARVLVTGGAGMIGSHIVDELLKESVAKIIVFDNFSIGTIDNLRGVLKDNRVEIVNDGGDIRNKDILHHVISQSDYIFHLACMRIRQCHDYPITAWESNVNGTLNLLSSAVQCASVKRIIYSSSASVYGDAIDDKPITEDHPFNNDNIYGASKIACEQLFRAYCKQYKQNYVGLRYMNVYGPRQDYRGAYTTVIMKVLDCIDKNKPPIIYGDGKQAYDFILAKDVAKANVLALKYGKTDSYYNIGTGIKTNITELVEIIMSILNSNQQIEYKDAGITWVKNRVGSTEKAEKELHFKSKRNLTDGLKELIKWRQEQQT